MDSKKVQRGYNLRKLGRNSHHPLMAFVADIRMIANLWLRPDSGFSDQAFLNGLDQRCMHYLVAPEIHSTN